MNRVTAPIKDFVAGIYDGPHATPQPSGEGPVFLGIKNVTANEPFFQGHFPGKPIMPGVLIVEAMAQTAAVLVVNSIGKQVEGSLVYFMSV